MQNPQRPPQRIIRVDQPPPPPIRVPYPDLDALFGDVFSNLLGEPITPNKIAIFYLVRILFQTHFGFGYERSDYEMFTTKEKSRIFHYLYGLITNQEELTYATFRRAIGMIFKSNRNITLNFISAMELIGSGHAGVSFSIEDEFYSHKYRKDPTLDPHDRLHILSALEAEHDMKFSSQHSFLYSWLKRLLAQYSKTTSQEFFDINRMMRLWIRNDHLEKIPRPNRLGAVLPREIDSSMRARSWVSRNIYLVQKNPQLADPFDHILNYVKMIQSNQPDVYESHLLESMVHVQMKDCPSAIRAMKMFFIDSGFELNDNMKHCKDTHRLAVPSQAPLMYAPILEARICRSFGDFTTARSLLNESLQQSQLRSDEVCHQMGNMELHTLNIIGNGPLLEDRTVVTSTSSTPVDLSDSDRRIHRKALKHIDDLHGHPRCGPCCAQTENDSELVAELDSYGMMLMLMKGVVEGQYRLKYSRNAETGIACPLGADLEERGRKVSNYGHALMSSNMIHNGLYKQARTTTSDMLTGNVGLEKEDVFYTESMAIGAANLAYSHAALGNYSEALNTISVMKSTYPDNLTWQSARHTTICESVIRFEMSFLLKKYTECRHLIAPLAQYSQIEFQLRKGLILCATGRNQEGILLLKNMNMTDLRGRIRCHLQLASMYTSNGSYSFAFDELDKAVQLANGTTLLDIRAMIGRRLATALMCRGDYHQAWHHITRFAQDIDQYGSYTERCCFYLTAAKCARSIGVDSRYWLSKARSMNLRKYWPTMEKVVLFELASVHRETGQMPDRGALGQIIRMFETIQCDFPGGCDWLLI